MPAICHDTLPASTPHDVDEMRQSLLRNVIPCINETCREFISVGWAWIKGIQAAPKLIPQMPNWIEMRGIAWPLQSCNVLGFKELGCYSPRVRRSQKGIR